MSEVEKLAKFLRQCGWGALYGLVAVALWETLPDDTDQSIWTRSGLHLHIDAGTGCQWLSTSQGALRERLDASGHQVCHAPVSGAQP